MSSKDKSKKWNLPPEAMKFAKQMGLDLSGLEPEAMQIWSHLEKLSSDNPVEYERFVSEQMQAAKEEGGVSSSSDGGRSFRPTAEFVIDTKSCSGDGAIIRDVSSSFSKTLHINMCSSELIQEPTDKFNKPISEDRHVADGLQIPLLIGPIRKVDELRNAVDVILHPKVSKICKQEQYFKKQIIDLAFDWISQEREIQFDRKNYQEPKSPLYKGGLGDNGEIPVLFQISDEMLADDGNKPSDNKKPASSATSSSSTSSSSSSIPDPKKKNGKNENVLSSTKSLLSKLNQTQQEEELPILNTAPTPTTTSASVASSQATKPTQPKKPIIEEIGGKSKVEEPLEDTIDSGTKKKVSFPESMVEVSSTNNKTPASASFTQSTIPPVSSSSNQPVSQTVEPPLAPTPTYKPPSKRENELCLDLLAQIDPDFADQRIDYGGTDQMGILGDLAKAFAADNSRKPHHATTSQNEILSTSTMPITAATPKQPSPTPKQEIQIINPQPTVIPVDAALSKTDTGMMLTVNVNGLKEGADPSTFDLEASESMLKIRCSLNNFLGGTTSNPTETIFVQYHGSEYIFDKQHIKASYKKKQKKLIISVGCTKLSK